MTPHIKAKKGDIAKTVIMPGDPLRAKFIAETYLENYQLINDVRGMLGYTGTYKGKRVTVMGSGMGMPSIGIYSYELFKVYDVDTIIRVGSCGAYTKKLDLYDIILVTSAYSESNYAHKQSGYTGNILFADESINEFIKETAKRQNIEITEGVIHSSDVFYVENNNFKEIHEKYNCLGVEMESFALFHNANLLNKTAACILTVSDSLVTKAVTTSEERQTSFTKMIELALESIQQED
ncbi:MAG: purine-nucleoside phosphorylase [Bacilli bacterium]|nr:purine-nucleoside phosphorylase [Bacilli bacterium]MDD4607816.1 purine-nucleoside phosphorylase [Bacilli bacterium]